MQKGAILRKCVNTFVPRCSFHLNKNHIQAKFNDLTRLQEVVIRVLLVYLDYFISFAKLEIYANCV